MNAHFTRNSRIAPRLRMAAVIEKLLLRFFGIKS